jgi:hypothetical protein
MQVFAPDISTTLYISMDYGGGGIAKTPRGFVVFRRDDLAVAWESLQGAISWPTLPCKKAGPSLNTPAVFVSSLNPSESGCSTTEVAT